MLCDMQNVLKNSAGRIGELQRTNVRGALPALVCLAAVLWLAVACGPKYDLTDYDPATYDQSWTGECIAHLEEGGEITVTTEDADSTANRPTRDELWDVIDKYGPLLDQQPTVWSIGPGRLDDEDGNPTDEMGIVLLVDKKVDQSELPPEDRIPDCLDGVPVQIIEDKYEPGIDFFPGGVTD